MPKEKSPGLKILWLWTFGTAAVLVGNALRTTIRDMDALMNAEQQKHHDPPQMIMDTLPPQTEADFPDDKT
ncbi:hypothetical protein HN51_020036 [Arachis hypogaea]|uniref:Uncharacterized protein n=2 Tax=Arachis TaxID=3817 RepID=A0A445BZG2_ARAHY|nr:uncharacterized protein LOC107462773 [Arachis duranensis]QHO31898.1 uncharacterized protein DS421_8g245440 [Arachis hypogaea]RYR44022.1 hypothetical protein Ahy_A08g040406 [Arachis hypogaea]